MNQTYLYLASALNHPGRHLPGSDLPSERHCGYRGGQPKYQVGEAQRGWAQSEPVRSDRECGA